MAIIRQEFKSKTVNMERVEAFQKNLKIKKHPASVVKHLNVGEQDVVTIYGIKIGYRYK